MKNYLTYKETILSDLSESFEEFTFKCFIKKININISVFFVYGASNNLNKNDNWQKISEEIALKYQSKINDLNDKWNIYIIYVCSNEVNKTLKNKIENDKFSSRKIVEDKFEGVLTDEKVNEFIIKHITNTDLKDLVERTIENTELDYEPVEQKIWNIIPKNSLISGDKKLQTGLLEQIKNIQNEN